MGISPRATMPLNKGVGSVRQPPPSYLRRLCVCCQLTMTANSHMKKKPQFGASMAIVRLMRLNNPIGIYLVLWPTLWSLWLAAEGAPTGKNLFIFIVGCVLMRSAGCVINDYADRDLDGQVFRTRERPLVTGEVSPLEALGLFAVLCFLAFLLILFTNLMTIAMAAVGLCLTISYPFMKRYTHLPQVVLGAAFACAIPMAFAAQLGDVPRGAWLVYIAVLLWTVSYDTFYAMVDRDDDIDVGIKSTAVLFGELDKVMTASLQALTLITLLFVGGHFKLSWVYYLSLAVAALLFGFQQYTIRDRDRTACFKAFLNNNWVGMVVFIGIAAHYAIYPSLS